MTPPPPADPLCASDLVYLSPLLHLSVFEKQIIGRGDGLFCRSVGIVAARYFTHTITRERSALRLRGHEFVFPV